jgi:hypothetical protein
VQGADVPDHLLRRHPVHALHASADVQDSRRAVGLVRVLVHVALGQVVSEAPEPLLALAQRLLDGFAGRDVLHDARHARPAPFTVLLVPAGGPDPANLPVHTPDAAFEAPVGLRARRVPERTVHGLAIFGHDVLEEHLVGPRGKETVVPEDPIVLQRAMRRVIGQIQFPPPGVALLERERQPALARLEFASGLPAALLGALVRRHVGLEAPEGVALADRQRRGQGQQQRGPGDIVPAHRLQMSEPR